MSKEVTFLIYCIEVYKNAKDLNGRQVMALFDKYNVIEYVISYFEALHTTGERYIVDDIDLYIAAREA